MLHGAIEKRAPGGDSRRELLPERGLAHLREGHVHTEHAVGRDDAVHHVRHAGRRNGPPFRGKPWSHRRARPHRGPRRCESWPAPHPFGREMVFARLEPAHVTPDWIVLSIQIHVGDRGFACGIIATPRSVRRRNSPRSRPFSAIQSDVQPGRPPAHSKSSASASPAARPNPRTSRHAA